MASSMSTYTRCQIRSSRCCGTSQLRGRTCRHAFAITYRPSTCDLDPLVSRRPRKHLVHAITTHGRLLLPVCGQQCGWSRAASDSSREPPMLREHLARCLGSSRRNFLHIDHFLLMSSEFGQKLHERHAFWVGAMGTLIGNASTRSIP